ncbi:MAG TPA: HU family DNA-binding protein [Chthoniobacterales bacterium]
MTKTELQLALAEATQTNKKAAGAFLQALGAIAYKAVKKQGEFVLPGFGKLVKQKRKARTSFNPQTRQKVRVAAKTVVKFRVAKGAKDAILGVKTPVAAILPKEVKTPTNGRTRAKASGPQASADAKPATGRARRVGGAQSGRA